MGLYCDVERIPVRMFWKASSTLLASRADVSMKERLLSPAKREKVSQQSSGAEKGWTSVHTSKLLGLLGRHGAKMPQIALITDQHDDNVTVCVVPKLLQPPRDVFVGLMFTDVVNKESANSTTVVG